MNKTWQIAEANSCLNGCCEFCGQCGDDEDD